MPPGRLPVFMTILNAIDKDKNVQKAYLRCPGPPNLFQRYNPTNKPIMTSNAIKSQSTDADGVTIPLKSDGDIVIFTIVQQLLQCCTDISTSHNTLGH